MTRSENSTIALSLISHTNAGKTTLARTLLGRDVGAVRDEQHVTQQAASYPLIETGAGDVLLLWDTPGFGDSARLARRLAQQHNPVGWFLSQVWDRFRDHALFLSQQVVRNVRDSADVVLYLVNAAEAPQDAGYLEPELTILDWIGKPVIVVLNQTGRPRPRAEEQHDETRWRNALSDRRIIGAVTTLDAFARCWVQESALFDLVRDAVPQPKLAAYDRLVDAWLRRRRTQFDEAIGVLSEPIAAACCDGEPITDAGIGDALRDIGRTIGIRRDAADDVKAQASRALAARLDGELRRSTDRLIALYGIEGRAKGEVVARLASGVTLDAPVSERKAAMMGGVVSGALTGLAADVAAGGLTFGAGLLTGAVVGALGGAGIARGMNVARGKSGTTLRWNNPLLSRLVESALLRYLAVAHYGRGRGDWTETEYPPFWPPLVAEIVDKHRDRLAKLWTMRQPTCDADAIDRELRRVLADAATDMLNRLYPGTLALFNARSH